MSSARSGHVSLSDRWLLLHSMWMSSPHDMHVHIYHAVPMVNDPFKSSLLPHIFVQLKLLERPEPTTIATLIECPFQIHHQVLSLIYMLTSHWYWLCKIFREKLSHYMTHVNPLCKIFHEKLSHYMTHVNPPLILTIPNLLLWEIGRIQMAHPTVYCLWASNIVHVKPTLGPLC